MLCLFFFIGSSIGLFKKPTSQCWEDSLLPYHSSHSWDPWLKGNTAVSLDMCVTMHLPTATVGQGFWLPLLPFKQLCCEFWSKMQWANHLFKNRINGVGYLYNSKQDGKWVSGKKLKAATMTVILCADHLRKKNLYHNVI